MTLINVGASVRDRLLAKARTEKLDFNLLLTRYEKARSAVSAGAVSDDLR